MCTAAGVGPRPEKSGKESTSLGMSSLPTSDGFNHPAHSLGQSPEIGNPTSLARSVSASVCPVEPSDPDSIEHKDVKALKASAEFQIVSKQKVHLPLQDLAEHASSADHAPAGQSPAMPLQNSSEEAIANNLEKFAEGSTQGLKCHLHTRQETSLSVTTMRMHEPQVLPGQNSWHPENQNLSQANGLEQHEEPECDQSEVAQQNAPCDLEHLHSIGDLELPGERQQNPQNSVDLEGAVKGDEPQQSVDLPSTETRISPSGCFGCSHLETLMEVDLVEQSLVAALNSAENQNANVKSISISDLTLDNPSMEVETSKCNPSAEILSNSIFTQDLQPPESNVEISGTNTECSNYSPLSFCGSCQPSVESAEDSCSSVTAALKELHELLVISSKPASDNISDEGICQSETVAEDQVDLSEQQTQNEHLAQNEQCPHVSFYHALSVSVKTEKLTDTSSGTETEGGSPGNGLSADMEGVLKSRGAVNESSSVTVTSAKTSNQLHCTVGVEISPKLVVGEKDALDQTSEQTKSLSSGFILVKDLGQGIPNPVTDRPETRENVCPESARPFLEWEPPSSYPSASPSILPPFFPAADIDRILRAGFTLQEALGALHRVGGNADLALLVLLAKNIVVPT